MPFLIKRSLNEIYNFQNYFVLQITLAQEEFDELSVNTNK